MSESVTLMPRLAVAGAAAAIDCYARVFGATEAERYTGPEGQIVHAELAIGDARLTVKDEDDTDPAPTSAGGSPVLLMLRVDDPDAVAERMAASGGAIVFPVSDSPHGRGGRIADPFGHIWMITQRAGEPRAAERHPPGQPDTPTPYTLADLQRPWCVLVAATLRIAHLIDSGITGAADLAAAAGCDGYALRAMLGYLAAEGIFEQPSPGQFALNDAARGLLDPSTFLDLNGIGGRMAGVWSSLPGYVRTGQPGYQDVFGLPFWEDLAAHPDIAASFDALMGPAGHGTPDPRFEITGGWDKVRTIVDVGGGTGAMLTEILRTRPGLRGTLVDLPGTVARASEAFRAAGLADRVSIAGQSFFDPLPAGADLYLLKKVLNDWPDRETIAILRRCAGAAGRDGRVVILGGVTPDDAPPALTIEMVLLGAKTSTLAEFRELAGQARLEVVAAGPQPAGYLVECAPA
jgi:2,7-dihydroxy-5-methyl-1-naphthoate 7-O-methyltransferase